MRFCFDGSKAFDALRQRRSGRRSFLWFARIGFNVRKVVTTEIARRGFEVSEERLSKLQRTTLKILQESKTPFFLYRDLCRFAAEETKNIMSMQFRLILSGPTVNDSFRSTFSQSLRNLADKGLVKLYYYSLGCVQKVRQVELTDKGKSLNLNKYVKNKKFADRRKLKM